MKNCWWCGCGGARRTECAGVADLHMCRLVVKLVVVMAWWWVWAGRDLKVQEARGGLWRKSVGFRFARLRAENDVGCLQVRRLVFFLVGLSMHVDCSMNRNGTMRGKRDCSLMKNVNFCRQAVLVSDIYNRSYAVCEHFDLTIVPFRYLIRGPRFCVTMK